MGTQPFMGEIVMFAFGFTPRGYAACAGQLLAINQNQALFSLLGTTYGGDGQTTFALPDLRGRAAVGLGNGPGLSPVAQGERAGQESVALTISSMPVHNHTLTGTSAAGTKRVVNNSVFGAQTTTLPGVFFYGSPGSPQPLAGPSIDLAGSNQPHENMQPSSVTSYCIALTGIFPSRN